MNSADIVTQTPKVIETDADRFELLSVIGEGGCAVVYKAHQIKLDRTVAVKMLNPSHKVAHDWLLRMQREASAVAQLDHPNIVKVHCFGMHDAQAFIAMEYVDGLPLSDYVRKNGKLPLEQFYNLFVPLLAALAYVHERGIVHRDLKPENIMVTTDGAVKLMDFGIAKALTDSDDQRLTATGVMLGSPIYMSPEQCEGKQPDARSDIYSLGATMHYALAGKPPFTGDSALDVMFQHLHHDADTLSDVAGSALSAVVAKAMEKDPQNRFQSAGDFLTALEAAKSGTQTVPSRKRKHARVSVLRAAIACASILTVAFICSLNRSTNDPHVNGPSEKDEQLQVIRRTENVKNMPALGLQRTNAFLNLAKIYENEQNYDEAANAWKQSAFAADNAFVRELDRIRRYHECIYALLNINRFAEAEAVMAADRRISTAKNDVRELAYLKCSEAEKLCKQANHPTPEAIKLAQDSLADFQREEEDLPSIDHLEAAQVLEHVYIQTGRADDAAAIIAHYAPLFAAVDYPRDDEMRGYLKFEIAFCETGEELATAKGNTSAAQQYKKQLVSAKQRLAKLSGKA